MGLIDDSGGGNVKGSGKGVGRGGMAAAEMQVSNLKPNFSGNGSGKRGIGQAPQGGVG